MSEEDQDYEGPWPREDAMTEWVMVPRNATPEMVSALDDFRNGPHSARAAYRAMLDAAPAAPQQAKPVGYFQRDCDYFEQVEDVYQWDADVIPLYLHPPAAEVQRLRDALEYLIEKCGESDDAQYGTLGTRFVRNIARRALEGK